MMKGAGGTLGARCIIGTECIFARLLSGATIDDGGKGLRSDDE